MAVDAVTDEPLFWAPVLNSLIIGKSAGICAIAASEFSRLYVYNTHIGKDLLVVMAFHRWQQNRELNSLIKEMIAR